MSERRIRKPTEKGQVYYVDIIQKKMSSIFRSLRKKFDQISEMIENSLIDRTVIENVRSMYKEWLDGYDELFQLRLELVGLLENQIDIEHFEREGEAQDKELRVMKFNIDKFFLEHESQLKIQRDELLTTRSVANESDLGSFKSSTASSDRLREKQTKAELSAKRQALQNKRRIEFEKLELKMKEDEFELDTLLRISEARLQAIDEFDGEQPISPTPPVQRKAPVSFEEQPYSSTPLPARNDTVQEDEDFFDRRRRPPRDLQPRDRVEAVVRQLRKPVPEIKKFAGNPTEYTKFMRQFRVKIIANTETDDERLNYLEQFTTGEANQIVSGYSYLDSETGYQAALQELEERYGDDQVIAQSFIKRALNWPNLRPDDSKALDHYAIFLCECQHAVASIHAVKVLEYPDNIRKLVAKLPFYLHDKWRNEVLKCRTHHETIAFSKLVDFVKREARKVNDPIYGREAMKPDYNTNKTRFSVTNRAKTSKCHRNCKSKK